MSIDIEKLFEQSGKRWLDPNVDYGAKGWRLEKWPRPLASLEARVNQHSSQGKEVRAGYFATSIRGFHEYVLLSRKTQRNEER